MDMVVPEACGLHGTKEQIKAQLKAKLSRIPTRFKIEPRCDAPLLASAAMTLVQSERGRIVDFFKRQ